MDARQLPANLDAWLASRKTEPRSDGHHVSVLLIGMLKRLLPKQYAHYGKPVAPGDRPPQFELGYMWEDMLGSVLDERLLLGPGESLLGAQTELEKDGIYGTPDRIVLSTSWPTPIVEETKVTWKWHSDDIEDPKFLYWVLQVKTYCAMVGATKARIRALFVNELRRGEFVVPGVWELTWAPHELTEWWHSVTRYAESNDARPGRAGMT